MKQKLVGALYENAKFNRSQEATSKGSTKYCYGLIAKCFEAVATTIEGSKAPETQAEEKEMYTDSTFTQPVAIAAIAGQFPTLSGTIITLANPPTAAGQSQTFTHNGKTLTAEFVAATRTKYAKQQSATPDNMILLNDNNVYNGETLALIGNTGFGSGRRASVIRDSVYYGFAGNVLSEKNMSTGTTTALKDFSAQGNGEWKIGQDEGNFSYDENHVVVNINNGSDWHHWNKTTDTVTTRTSAQMYTDAANVYSGETGFNRIDWVTSTPCGFIVARIDKSGDNEQRRYVLYDAGFTNPRRVGNGTYGAAHACSVKGKNGECWLVTRHWSGCSAVDLNNPTRVIWLPLGGDDHYSGVMSFARNGAYIHSSVEPTSEVIIGIIDANDYDFTGATSTTDSSRLGTHYRPKSGATMVQEAVGSFPYGSTSYPASALADGLLDGSAVFVTGNNGSDYVMKITAQA